MRKEVLRNYHSSDAAMLAHAKAVLGFLQVDLPEFTSFDSTINAEFLAAFIVVLAAAEVDVSDNVISDRQVQLSNIAKKKHKESVKAYNDLAYFIRKAFDSKAIQNELGISNFAGAKRSKNKMILFLRDLISVLPKYRAELIAAGCSEEIIDNIAPLQPQLNAATTESKQYKSNRPVVTQERVIKYNELWTKVRIVIEAAKMIYSDNVPKLKRYLMPSTSSRSTDIKVVAGAQLVGLNGGLNPGSYLEIKNTGKSSLVFYVADTVAAEVPGNAITIKAGESSTMKIESISNGGFGALIAANQTATESAFVAHVLE